MAGLGLGLGLGLASLAWRPGPSLEAGVSLDEARVSSQARVSFDFGAVCLLEAYQCANMHCAGTGEERQCIWLHACQYRVAVAVEVGAYSYHTTQPCHTAMMVGMMASVWITAYVRHHQHDY